MSMRRVRFSTFLRIIFQLLAKITLRSPPTSSATVSAFIRPRHRWIGKIDSVTAASNRFSFSSPRTMENDASVYTYRGVKNEQIPSEVERVRIHKDCKIILERAFSGHGYLEEVYLHEGVEKIEYGAFYSCNYLRCINLPSKLSVIGTLAFAFCEDLLDLELPENLREIGEEAFRRCNSLAAVKLPSNLDVLGRQAFHGCEDLEEVIIPSGNKRIGIGYKSFGSCTALKRIVIPLNVQLLSTNHQIFDSCDQLTSINITGVSKIVSSLTIEKWKNEINTEMKRINSILPKIKHGPKTTRMETWMETVHFKIEGYKLEHNRLMKEAMSLLEMALWKAKLEADGFTTKKRKRRALSRVNCGAAAVITNVCSYLAIFDVQK